MEDVPYEEIIGKLEEMVVVVKEGAVEGGEYVFPLLVRRQIAVGIFWVIIGIGLLYSCYRMVKFFRGLDEYEKDEDCFFGLLLFCAITIVPGIGALYHGMIRLVVPQWYAVKEIIETIR